MILSSSFRTFLPVVTVSLAFACNGGGASDGDRDRHASGGGSVEQEAVPASQCLESSGLPRCDEATFCEREPSGAIAEAWQTEVESGDPSQFNHTEHILLIPLQQLEAMEPDTMVHLSTGGHSVETTAADRARIAMGERVTVHVGGVRCVADLSAGEGTEVCHTHTVTLRRCDVQ